MDNGQGELSLSDELTTSLASSSGKGFPRFEFLLSVIVRA
jgi:hypothetical protein